MLTEKRGKALRGLDFRHKKRPQLRSIYILMVPKAGLEPARISTVDFESTASTDFATSALQVVCGKRVHYTFQRSTCNTYPLFNELSAEKIVDGVTFEPFCVRSMRRPDVKTLSNHALHLSSHHKQKRRNRMATPS